MTRRAPRIFRQVWRTTGTVRWCALWYDEAGRQQMRYFTEPHDAAAWIAHLAQPAAPSPSRSPLPAMARMKEPRCR